MAADNYISNAGSGGLTFRADDVGGGPPTVHVPAVKIINGVAGTDGGFILPTNPLDVQLGDGTNLLTVSVLGTTTYTEATSTGVIIGAVRNDTLAALADTDNEIAPLQVNNIGALWIQEGAAMDVSAATVTVDGSGVTQPVSAASLPLPTGAATSALQLADGHNVTIDNASGGSAVNIQDGGNTITVDNGGTFAVQADSVIPGVGATSLGKAEDAAHTSGDTGVAMLGVHHALDADGVDADTDLDYAMPHIDVRGRMRVSPGSLYIIDTFTVTTGWSVLNDDAGNIVTNLNHILAANSLSFDKLDGTANTTDAIIQKTVTSFNAFNLVTGAIFIQAFVNIPTVTNAVNYIIRLGTDASNYNEWRIDATGATAGVWEVIRVLLAKSTAFAGNGMNLTAITYAAVGVEFTAETTTLAAILWDGLLLNGGQVHDVDIAAETAADVRLAGYKTSNVDTGSGVLSNSKTLRVVLATDQPVVSTNWAGTSPPIGAGTEAAALRVTVATDSTGLLPVSVASLPLPSGAATSALQLVDGHNVTIDNASGGAAVNIQDGGNVITVDGTVVVTHPALGGGTEAGAQRVTIASDSTGTLTVDAVSAAFSATVVQGTPNNLQSEVSGTVAADAAVSGNPVLVGYRASNVEPTAMSADGDSVHPWADRFGRQVMVHGHPPDIATADAHGPHTENQTASGDQILVAAPGAGSSIHVTGFWASNNAATKIRAALRDGTTARYTGTLAADGGGVARSEIMWVLADNAALNGNLGATGDVDWSIDYFVAPTPA